MDNFGAWFRQTRESRGWATQIAFAKAAGVHKDTISKIESSEVKPNLKPAVWNRISATLDSRRGRTVRMVQGSREIPVVNATRAGQLRESAEWGTLTARDGHTYVDGFRIGEPDAFALIVEGQSMAPAVLDGDMVIFGCTLRYDDITPEEISGQIVYVLLEDEARPEDGGGCVCRARAMGGRLLLLKDNPAFAPLDWEGRLQQLCPAIELRRSLRKARS